MMIRPDIYAVLVMAKCIVILIFTIWAISFRGASLVFKLGECIIKPRFGVCFTYYSNIVPMVAFLIPFVSVPLLIVVVLTTVILLIIRRRN